jgi:hypothetical protein
MGIGCKALFYLRPVSRRRHLRGSGVKKVVILGSTQASKAVNISGGAIDEIPTAGRS